MVLMSGWGRFPRLDCVRRTMRDWREAAGIVASEASLIARGNGRAYGDAALNRDCVLETLAFDRILAFDAETGAIRCEAGLLLADLLAFAVPRGFFPPVTPGTKFVTIGGMVAADVHGKNHHGAGSFGRHVEALQILLADGRIVTCSRAAETELFLASCGGMGLTGMILSVAFRLIRIETGLIRQRTIRAPALEAATEALEAESAASYSVAWIDCLAGGAARGRSLIYLGEHVGRADVSALGLDPPPPPSLALPLDMPSFVLNGWSARAFDAVYYRRGRPGTALVSYDRYFYPLDKLAAWNRLYGRPGFLQYQCVIPRAAGRAVLGTLLDRIRASGEGAFLAVLKLFGPADPGYLSFPMEGYTLALDFPARPAILTLLTTLDRIVADAGGRLYLAKDARSAPDMLSRGYPQLDRFRAVRAAVDPGGKFSSALSARLGL
jgi:decaprenylphospho-beta-D-ribofuranose 2-oxidase